MGDPMLRALRVATASGYLPTPRGPRYLPVAASTYNLYKFIETDAVWSMGRP